MNNLKNILTVLIVAILLVPSFLSATEIDKAKVHTDSLLLQKILELDNQEFKKVLLEVLQNNNLTNKPLFIKQIKKTREGSINSKRTYGLKNIENYDGWNVAASGIIIVFLGLILIATIVVIFNQFFAGKENTLAEKHVSIFEEVKQATTTSIPEEELVAITTALELYKRLYADAIPARLTFREVGQDTWKLKYKFGHRQK